MGLPTFMGGSGFYETGPAAYADTHWTVHHYHRSSPLGEITVICVFILLTICLIAICCSICRDSGPERYEEDIEENEGLMVEHREVK